MTAGYRRKLWLLIGCTALAVFACSIVGVTQPTFTLTVTKTGTGTVISTSNPTQPNQINCGNTCSVAFTQGATVTLTATPNTGTSWSGCNSVDANNRCIVTMNSNRTVNVTFPAITTFTLTVTKPGAGTGTVTSTSNPTQPNQINCGSTCSVSFNSGTSVTLRASPEPGSVFADVPGTGWGGACSGTATTCTVTMNADKSVTATFLPGFTLTVTKAGTGSGTVTSTSNPTQPKQIDCGGTCSASFSPRTRVTLTATRDPSSTFRGWGGACSGRGDCTVTLDTDKAITATFSQRPSLPTDGCEGTSQDDIILTCEEPVIRGDGNGIYDDGPNACSSSRCGNDLIIGSDDDDQIYGDDSLGGWRDTGRDIIYGREGNDTIYGESGNDRLYGEADDDILDGGARNDRLEGGDGDDILQGGPGRDVIFGGEGDDVLYGDSGNDILRGGEGMDTIDGGTGNDIIDGGLDSDFLVGGGGNDTFIVRAGDAGDDIETIICTQAHNETGMVILKGEFSDLALGRFRDTMVTIQDTSGVFEIITGPGVCVISRR